MKTKKKIVLFGLLGVGVLVLGSPLISSANNNTNVPRGTLDFINTRGGRNKNLLNIRGSDSWKGKRGVDNSGFIIFDTYINGIRASIINLRNQNLLHGIDTIYRLVKKYTAGDSEEIVGNYSKFIGNRLNPPIDDYYNSTLNFRNDEKTIKSVIFSMIIFENALYNISIDQENQIKTLINKAYEIAR